MAAGNLTKTLFGIVKQFDGRHGFGLESRFAGFDASQRQQILSQARHAGRILADDLEKLTVGAAVFGDEVEQSLGISLNGSERGTQFMGDIGDEIAAGFLDALGLGEVAQDGNSAAIGQGRSGDVVGAAGNDRSGARRSDFFGGGGGLYRGEEIGIADGFDDRGVKAGAWNQAIHGLIGPLHQAIGADGDDSVLHAVEQSFELALAGADGGEAAFDLSGGAVDGGGDASDFITGSVVDARSQVSQLNSG